MEDHLHKRATFHAFPMFPCSVLRLYFHLDPFTDLAALFSIKGHYMTLYRHINGACQSGNVIPGDSFQKVTHKSMVSTTMTRILVFRYFLNLPPFFSKKMMITHHLPAKYLGRILPLSGPTEYFDYRFISDTASFCRITLQFQQKLIPLQ